MCLTIKRVRLQNCLSGMSLPSWGKKKLYALRWSYIAYNNDYKNVVLRIANTKFYGSRDKQ